jgi:prevent-host-death family protein
VVSVKVTSAQARARLPALVSDVAHKGSRVIIEKHGKPMAALVSIEDLQKLESASVSGHKPLGALALVGAWAGVTDEQIDAFLKDIYSSRRKDKGRPVNLEL